MPLVLKAAANVATELTYLIEAGHLDHDDKIKLNRLKDIIEVNSINTLGALLREVAEEFYLDYFNSYLTTEKMADHYGISDELAVFLMLEGQKINHARTIKGKS